MCLNYGAYQDKKPFGHWSVWALQVRQRGSHVVLEKQSPEGEVGCVVPLHREVAIGTLRGILRQARVTPEEFLENL